MRRVSRVGAASGRSVPGEVGVRTECVRSVFAMRALR